MKLTQGQALDIASRAALKYWPKPGLPNWKWARSKPGISCPWLITIGDNNGAILRILVDDTGDTTIAVA